MPPLRERLVTVLAAALPVTEESDGALTVHHQGTLASLRVVNIAKDLDLVSLTQVLAWDLPLDPAVRAQLTEHAHSTQLGTVTVVEKAPENSENAGGHADVLLRYNFPGTGLADEALRTLVLLVLEIGADIRQSLTA